MFSKGFIVHLYSKLKSQVVTQILQFLCPETGKKYVNPIIFGHFIGKYWTHFQGRQFCQNLDCFPFVKNGLLLKKRIWEQILSFPRRPLFQNGIGVESTVKGKNLLQKACYAGKQTGSHKSYVPCKLWLKIYHYYQVP